MMLTVIINCDHGENGRDSGSGRGRDRGRGRGGGRGRARGSGRGSHQPRSHPVENYNPATSDLGPAQVTLSSWVSLSY